MTNNVDIVIKLFETFTVNLISLEQSSKLKKIVCTRIRGKDKWHLEDRHIALGTADTVSGQ